jgi:hypothetical protein
MRYLIVMLALLTACQSTTEPIGYPHGCRLTEVIAPTPGHPGITLEGVQHDPAICEDVARHHPEITVTALVAH